MLPREKSEGEYAFLVKNGVQPLRLVLTPSRDTQSCSGTDTNSAIWHGKEAVEFDLTGSPASVPKIDVVPGTSQAEAQRARVFPAGPKGSSLPASTIKAFRDHCPRVLVAAEKENANYTVEITPSSFTRSKNMVIVVKGTGDVVHSGAALNLGNAVKVAAPR